MHLLSLLILGYSLVRADYPYDLIVPTKQLIDQIKSYIPENPGLILASPCSDRESWNYINNSRTLSGKSAYNKNIFGESWSFLNIASQPLPPWIESLYLEYNTTIETLKLRDAGQKMTLARTDRLQPWVIGLCHYWDSPTVKLADNKTVSYDSLVQKFNDELLSMATQDSWAWAAHDSRKHF